MQLIDAYKKFWQNYANFQGRTRRSDYWYFVLANLIIEFAINILKLPFVYPSTPYVLLGYINTLYSLAILIPSIAICVRRLHDIGKSGAYFLFILIPLVGPIILLVWYATDSQPGTNQYGISEKYPNANANYAQVNTYDNVQPNGQPIQQNDQATQTNQTYSDQPNFCKHCGNKVDFNQTFCPKCGTKLK